MRAEDGRGFTTSTGRISNSSGVKPSHQPTTATSEKVERVKRTCHMYLRAVADILSIPCFISVLILLLSEISLSCFIHREKS